MKKSLIAFLAVAACGAAVGAGLGPQSYVQDGLVTQFDGIDNDNKGTHDPAATKWVDLKGKASVTLGSSASFGSGWMDSGTDSHSISGMPSGLMSNPITYDLCFNLIRVATTSTSKQWPSVFYANNAYLHSTGVTNMVGDAFARDFRFYVDSTEPRPYTKQVYTNTITCVSDATSIRVYQDGALNDSCTSKVARATNEWKLGNPGGSTYVQAHYFGVRVYNRGLTDDEIAHNTMVDRLRFIGPRFAGSGETVNWDGVAWKGPYGEDRMVPTATNECVTVANATVAVAATDTVALKALSLEDAATLQLAEGAVVSVRRLFVEGVEIPHGIYTAADWLTGVGEVRVAGALSAQIPDLLPQPAADGWYEFGDRNGGEGRMAGYKTSSTSYHWFRGDRPDFDRYAFPKGAKLRIVGYIMLDTIPAGVFDEVDFSQAKWVMLHKGTVFADGSPFVIPASLQNVRFQPGTWSSYTNVYWLTADGGSSGTIATDMVINGQFRQYGDGTQCPCTRFSGEVGGNGTIKLVNYSKQVRVSGAYAFTGSVSGWENGHAFWVDATNVTGRISNDLSFSSCGDTYNFNSSHCADGILFGVHNSAATANNELYVKSINGNARDLTDTSGKRWRCGGEVIVWGGNTVRVGELKGALHVVASTKDQNSTCYYLGSAVCKGVGNLAADKVSSTGDIFLSTNINVTAGSVTGGVRFNYTYQSNTVNRMTLDITNSCVTSARLYATDLQMLPARVSGFKGTVTLRDVAAERFQGATYAMTVDFDKALYTTDGCIGSGTLSAAPASGTVNVTLVGTPKKGAYSLFRFDSAVGAGGQPLFANWTVNVVGHEGESQFTVGSGENMKIVTVKKDATGLWLKVSNPGLQVILR